MPVTSTPTFAPSNDNLKSSGKSFMDNLIGCHPMGILEQSGVMLEKLLGIDLLYYRQNFDPKKAHPIYGDETSEFLDPYLIRGLVQMNTDNTLLSQFGIEAENDIDIQITYSGWETIFGSGVKPQAGDMFEVKDLLCNRPDGFTKSLYVVTSQGDDTQFDVSKRWKIAGKRADYSFLPNQPREKSGSPLFASKFVGVVDNKTLEPIIDEGFENPIERDIDDIAEDNFKNENSNVYGGGYYIDEDDM